MDPADLKLFQTVCFLTLMQHGEGLTSKAPRYIQEKMNLMCPQHILYFH